ncbi:glycosyltransferase family 4 protein [Candidatus Viridilinea mediisalina]|uniref:Glycosyl transferase family 1 n=1 Tax=Candidatus Viridilinea mediisalina TaxID=2024553 RepID=A0A2A6RN86_9CHLR|nr:glycosyltransferase family 4 protein [Candidatus Viridilinea mediisalina]PDW04348.1 glycosyl transferase family 1 [Candidatus Viridilinea mediisalina]
MRLLVLSTWWPEPADNGSRMRIMHLLRALSVRHELHLLAFSQGPPESVQHAELDGMCASVQAFARPGRPLTTADRLKSLVVSTPASVRATWSAQFAQAVTSAAARLRPDAVLALEIDVAPYARLVQRTTRILEDLELNFMLQQYRLHRAPHKRLRYLLTALKHRSYVRQTLRDFAAVTVVSSDEAQLVRAIMREQPVRVAVVPNGADVAGSSAYQYEPDADTLIYPGALAYHANLDAVQFFLHAIFPLIQRERPQTKLRITGRNTDEQRAALGSAEGLEFTGYVADIRALIARSSVEVVPLRQGSGTRLKILEALAVGTPVVSTRKGMEGLELKAGEHLMVADTPHAFAQATLTLLNDVELRQRLSQAGKQAVATRYDWRTIAADFCALVEESVHKEVS